jgi:UDP-glucose 6-dehydrogenase
MAARRTNENQPAEIVSHLRRFTSLLPGFAANPTITLLGIAFKGQPATDDLRGTMAKPVLECLREAFQKAKFRGYDAVVNSSSIRNFDLEPMDDLKQAFEQSSLILILNNHPQFSAMDIDDLAMGMKRPGLIYDFWNCFKASDLHLPNGITYMALGSHGKLNLL